MTRYLVHSMNASVEKAGFAGMMVQKSICGSGKNIKIAVEISQKQ